MKPDIAQITAAIDTLIEQSGNQTTTPVEANDMLAQKGLLKQSKTRPGIDLRNLLRAGLLPHAYQPGGKGSEWVIPHSKA
jgi:hypothetical protein